MDVCLIYRSRACGALNEEQFSIDLTKMLTAATLKNQSLGITGHLVYSAGMFYQVLEGKFENVTALFSIIMGDRRHDEIVILSFSCIHKRNFGSWDFTNSLSVVVRNDLNLFMRLQFIEKHKETFTHAVPIFRDIIKSIASDTRPPCEHRVEYARLRA